MMFRIFAIFLAFLQICFGFLPKDLAQILQTQTKGEFKQTKIIPNFDFNITSFGEFELNKNTLFWSVLSPISSQIKINKDGIFEKNGEIWHKINSQGVDIFLDLLSLDFANLEKKFEIKLNGSPNSWQIELVPRGAILRQIFTNIEIFGSNFVKKIILNETNGEKTINEFDIK